MQSSGVPIRFLRAVFLPEDDACFHLYQAASADDVRQAAHRAQIEFEGFTKAATNPLVPTPDGVDAAALDLSPDETLAQVVHARREEETRQ